MTQSEAIRLGVETSAEMKPIEEKAAPCYQCGT